MRIHFRFLFFVIPRTPSLADLLPSGTRFAKSTVHQNFRVITSLAVVHDAPIVDIVSQSFQDFRECYGVTSRDQVVQSFYKRAVRRGPNRCNTMRREGPLRTGLAEFGRRPGRAIRELYIRPAHILQWRFSPNFPDWSLQEFAFQHPRAIKMSVNHIGWDEKLYGHPKPQANNVHFRQGHWENAAPFETLESKCCQKEVNSARSTR